MSATARNLVASFSYKMDRQAGGTMGTWKDERGRKMGFSPLKLSASPASANSLSSPRGWLSASY